MYYFKIRIVIKYFFSQVCNMQIYKSAFIRIDFTEQLFAFAFKCFDNLLLIIFFQILIVHLF